MICKSMRTPRNYDGTAPTNRSLSQLLGQALGQISKRLQDKPDLILAAWAGLVGEEFASMSRAVAFENGILSVLVNNGALYSLLVQYERPKLVQQLQKIFPFVKIYNITFAIG